MQLNKIELFVEISPILTRKMTTGSLGNILKNL